MGCNGSKEKPPSAIDVDENGSEASTKAQERKRAAAAKKSLIHEGMSQQELDNVLDEQFFEFQDDVDTLTQQSMDWDNMDEFEFIDAATAQTPKSRTQSPASDFDPNDEDSMLQHFTSSNAEWVGPSDAPKVGSFPGVERKVVTAMDANTWCPGYGESFKLRIGPNYKKHGKKDHSRESMFTVVATDIIQSSSPNHNVASKMRLPKVNFTVNSEYVTPILVINIQLPLGAPWVMFRTNDGPCLQMVTTMVMKEKYARMWDDLARAPAACRQLEEYMKRAPEETDDGSKSKSYRWRWKFIGRSENGVPSALRAYNGKPALITQDGRLHRGGSTYTEMDINVADWCKAARVALYTMFQTVNERTLSLAHVIEAREDENMPEQTLCCMQIDRLACFTDKNHSNRAEYLRDHPEILDGDALFGVPEKKN